MSKTEKLAKVNARLTGIQERIAGYGLGDRPSSPSAELLREERRLREIRDWLASEIRLWGEDSPVVTGRWPS